jgi:hypothetical protein
MRYPTVEESKLAEIAPKLLENAPVAIATELSWVGTGEEMDSTLIDDLVATSRSAIRSEKRGPLARDRVEGELSGMLHRSLREVPPEVLEDAGWWRLLSVRLWDFVVWREEGAFESHDYRVYRRYIDGKLPSECVPLRMFLRAAIARVGDDYSLASAVNRGADLWRSHILRVRTGTAPALARAFIQQQVQDRMTTDELRPFASRLNRLWPNVVLNLYSEDEARDLLVELRESSV